MRDLHDLLIAGRMLGGSGGSPAPQPTLITKTITANGDYSAAADNADGYSAVSVAVPPSTLTTKTITANGTYNASSDNADGYSAVTVNVPIPSSDCIGGFPVVKTAANLQHMQYKAFSKDDYGRLTAGVIMCKEANEIFPFDTFSAEQDNSSATFTYCNSEIRAYNNTSNGVIKVVDVDYYTQDGSLSFVDEYAISSKACLLSFPYTSSDPYTAVVFGQDKNGSDCIIFPSDYRSELLYYEGFGSSMSSTKMYREYFNYHNYAVLVPYISRDGTKVADGIYAVLCNTLLHGLYEIGGSIFFISAGIAIKDE